MLLWERGSGCFGPVNGPTRGSHGGSAEETKVVRTKIQKRLFDGVARDCVIFVYGSWFWDLLDWILEYVGKRVVVVEVFNGGTCWGNGKDLWKAIYVDVMMQIRF